LFESRFGLLQQARKIRAVHAREHLSCKDLLASLDMQGNCSGFCGVERRTHSGNDPALDGDIAYQVATCNCRDADSLIGHADAGVSPALDPGRGDQN